MFESDSGVIQFAFDLSCQFLPSLYSSGGGLCLIILPPSPIPGFKSLCLFGGSMNQKKIGCVFYERRTLTLFRAAW